MRSRTFTARPRLEPLEVRTLLSTCHFTRLTDQGIGKGFRGDLRYCINKVNTNPGADTIDFHVTGTISLNTALPDLASDIDIVGPGAVALKVTRPTSAPLFRVFNVAVDANIEISGLTLSGGHIDGDWLPNSGGGIRNSGVLSIRESILENNRVHKSGFSPLYSFGGGIFNDGTLVVEQSIIRDNFVHNQWGGALGGAIANSGSLTLLDSVLMDNRADSPDAVAKGGAIHNSGDVTIIDSSLLTNLADSPWEDAFGGGLHNAGTAAIYGSTLANNTTNAPIYSSDGSAIINYGALTLFNSTVSGNTANGRAASCAVCSWGFTLIVHSTITANTGEGGALFGEIAGKEGVG